MLETTDLNEQESIKPALADLLFADFMLAGFFPYWSGTLPICLMS